MAQYEKVLELLKDRKKDGLEALYSSYGRKFYSYAIDKWSLNEDEAWEVIYKTLDTLVLKLPNYTFESQKHFENFVFKVYINYLRQHYRHNRKHMYDTVHIETMKDNKMQSIDTDYELDSQILLDHYQSDLGENSQLITLKNALNELEQLERDILLLKVQNYSYDEIAQLLKIENNQLKVKHHRAKQKLLKILDKNSQI